MGYKPSCQRVVSGEEPHMPLSWQVEFMGQIRHDNIVDLLAYCDEGREQILVFRFAEYGSLADWLRPPKGEERA